MFGILVDSGFPFGGTLLVLAVLFGFYMAWSIGANDVANAMGTSVGSGGLTLKKAVIIAAIMEFAGAVFVGSHVTETVRKGMFDAAQFDALPLVLGFMAALLASAIWLQAATWFGWPVSTTHSIVGAVVGVGILAGGWESIKWAKITSIVFSWVTSPLLGGFVAFLLFRLIQRVIIDSKYPLRATYRLMPFLVFYVAFVLCLVMVYKGLPKFNLDFTLPKALAISAATGLGFALLSLLWVRQLKRRHDRERADRHIEIEGNVEAGIPFVRKELRGDPTARPELRPALAPGSELPSKRWEYRREFEFEKVESIFAKLMIISACFLAFSHGANDVANAIGPLAAIIEIIHTNSVVMKASIPIWVLMMGALGIVIGLATWGYKVIETIGRKITQLTPSRGFAANIGAATTVVVASRMGLPISTTHTLVGAVLGIGLARGIGYLNLRVVRDIVISWVITIPAGALLAMILFAILRAVFPAP